ncbi:UNVERIFIED_CONTAM: hypothetical protein FKN15_026671 [Acipenser sinensis]
MQGWNPDLPDMGLVLCMGHALNTTCTALKHWLSANAVCSFSLVEMGSDCGRPAHRGCLAGGPGTAHGGSGAPRAADGLAIEDTELALVGPLQTSFFHPGQESLTDATGHVHLEGQGGM